MANCPKCGNAPSEGALFCDKCGTRLPQAAPVSAPKPAAPVAGGSIVCAACGAGNVPGEAFCEACGSALEAPLPEAPSPVQPVAEPVSTPEVVPAAPAAVCPACGAALAEGDAFCAACGASLAKAPLPPEPVAEEPTAAPEPQVEPGSAPEPPAGKAPEPVAPVAPVQEPTAPTPPAKLICTGCGSELEPGDKFCSECGAPQRPATPVPPPEPVVEPVVQPAVEPVVEPAGGAEALPGLSLGPRLVVVASGAVIPLPAKDQILIGREDPVSGIFPDVDLTPHGGEEGGVSRRHAEIIVEAGAYFVVDQNSTNWTYVNKLKLTAGARQPLSDGDEIRCGRVSLQFLIGG